MRPGHSAHLALRVDSSIVTCLRLLVHHSLYVCQGKPRMQDALLSAMPTAEQVSQLAGFNRWPSHPLMPALHVEHWHCGPSLTWFRSYSCMCLALQRCKSTKATAQHVFYVFLLMKACLPPVASTGACLSGALLLQDTCIIGGQRNCWLCLCQKSTAAGAGRHIHILAVPCYRMCVSHAMNLSEVPLLPLYFTLFLLPGDAPW